MFPIIWLGVSCCHWLIAVDDLGEKGRAGNIQEIGPEKLGLVPFQQRELANLAPHGRFANLGWFDRLTGLTELTDS